MKMMKNTAGITYEIIRSDRKTISVTVLENGEVAVRAPKRMTLQEIEAVVMRHAAWITKHSKQQSECAKMRGTLTQEEKEERKRKAQCYLPVRTAEFAEKMGVCPDGIKITAAEKRWGSCSGKNTICYSWRVMLLPDDLIDLIIVHELAHIYEKNHSAAFYRVMERYLPDYRERMVKLKAISAYLPR